MVAACLLFYAKQAVTPMSDSPPWQGPDYWCASCKPGRPFGKKGNAAWKPWCSTGTDLPC